MVQTVVVLSLMTTMLVTLTPVSGQAQDPGQVENVGLEHQDGFTTVSWDPVTGAGAYEIERTPVDDDDEPTGDPATVGVWRPNRQIDQESPTFADSGFRPGDRFRWRVRALMGSGLPNEVVIDGPSSAEGTYEATDATFGPPLDETGIDGEVVVVDDGTDDPTEGCEPLVDFPEGAIALFDRGSCTFVTKVAHAQEAGAVAAVIANNTGGPPIRLTGSGSSITIPSMMIWRDDGETIVDGLPAGGRVKAAPVMPLSEPVYGTTAEMFGPDEFLTEFETNEAARFTSYEAEIEWTERVAEESDRVRVVTIGHTAEGREINLFVIGFPEPPATAEEVAAAPTAGANCNVHGNEPSGREGCFMAIRDLAFSDDPAVIELLSATTVLVVPAINGDGRAANTRGNSTGQDLNRDHGRLTQPETQAFAAFLRDYTPEVMVDGHEFGSSSTCDLPLLWPRHSNTAPTVHDESKEGLVEDWFYGAGAADGWWPCPYPLLGIDGAQTFTRVTGLKNMLVTLVEARSSGAATRPGEGNTQDNRRRKAYSQLWAIGQALDYHLENQEAVEEAIAGGIEFQSSNTGPAVFHGDWDVEPFPAPHPGDNPPDNNPPGPDDMLDPPPCGYFLTEDQYTTTLDDSGSLPDELRTSPEQRLRAHGLAVEERPDGYVVRMTQPLRGLINVVLDPEQPPAPIIGAQRMFECPEAAADPVEVAGAAVEDTTFSASLAIGNAAPEPNADLVWEITEATDSCDEPSDVGWLSVSPEEGTTGASGSTTVEVSLDATGLVAPAVHEAVLCVATNDIGDAMVEVPVSLQVRYPVSGLAPPPAMTSVEARPTTPIRFSLDGDRGVDFISEGSPTMHPIDCVTGDPVGDAEPVSAGGPLQYDPVGDRYRYVLDAPEIWRGTCRQLVLSLDDGSTHLANYRFHR